MVRDVLDSFCGTLLTDGYTVYDRLTRSMESIVHAQCWAHTRRQFVNALMIEPQLVTQALEQIGAHYALDRQAALRVFLADPSVPLDTNHPERQIRPIAVGRKKWLFCWTEVGARCVGIVQSLIASCRLQGIDPYVYFVDVLQRIDTHPAFDVHLLTPRLWKQHFAHTLLRSNIDHVHQ